MNIPCTLCGEKLKLPGGILFSPPNYIKQQKLNLTEDIFSVDKRHLCITCYHLVIDYIHLLQQFRMRSK